MILDGAELLLRTHEMVFWDASRIRSLLFSVQNNIKRTLSFPLLPVLISSRRLESSPSQSPIMTNITLIVDWTCIVLFVLGFIGNLLGLVVFSSRRFRCCSTYATLALTSFAINLFFIVRYSLLQHSSTRLWLTNNVVNIHWLACKVFRLSSSLRVLSAWVTVFWVIERFIYVSSRLNVLFHRGERYQLLEKYQYVCMACVSLLAAMIVCGPTTYFDAPVAIRWVQELVSSCSKGLI